VPLLRERRDDVLPRARVQEGRVEDEGWRVRKDGSCFWAQALITAMRDASGTLIGFATVVLNLTGPRTAAVLLAKVRDVLDA